MSENCQGAKLCRSASALPTDSGARMIGFKSKNPEAPAVKREAEEDGSR
jgi:hypothetical protein